MLMLKTSLYFFFLSIFLVACDDSNPFDLGSNSSADPVIQNLTCSESVQKEVGAEFNCGFSFSDDNGLYQYRLRIEDDFKNARLSDAPWYFEEDYLCDSVLNYQENKIILLPYPDLEIGRYRLDIIVADIDQNEVNESRYFEIHE